MARFFGRVGYFSSIALAVEEVAKKNAVRVIPKQGQLKKALDQLNEEGFYADWDTFARLIKECGKTKALPEGILVHQHILRNTSKPQRFIQNLLVQMYGRCGDLKQARALFDRIDPRNAYSWTVMIGAYAQHGFDKQALQLFHQMRCEGVKPDKITLLAALNACANPSALAEGKMIHDLIVKDGFNLDIVVGNMLVKMYSKCGSIDDSRKIFDTLSKRDMVSWNAMISAYAKLGQRKQALLIFEQMKQEGLKPNKITYISLLSAYSSPTDLAEGKLVHLQIIENLFEEDVVVGTALVNMYGKCGSLEDARRMFEKMPVRNVISWNCMISAYFQNGNGKGAIQLYDLMQQQHITPDRVTVLNMLDVYGQSGNLRDACKIFNQLPQREVSLWNALIGLHTQHGRWREALQLFRKMQHDGVEPDKITFVNVLSACSNLSDLDQAKQIHALVADAGLESNVIVGTAIVNMYGKCRGLDDALNAFNILPHRDIVAWNAMIAAYAHAGHGREALHFFHHMKSAGLEPDRVTFVSLIDACADIAALAEGKHFHMQVIEQGYEGDIVVGNALVNMYGKGGTLEMAQTMFEKLPRRDVISWNGIITAYAQHACCTGAINSFQQMQWEGIKPNHVTFVSILSACNHAGLVDEGYQYFLCVGANYGVQPTLDHFRCIIDLLGRSGQLDEAETLLQKMPFKPDAMVWMTLLGVCRIHGDVERGQHAADRLLELDSLNAAAYVVLSNIYAEAGRWDDVVKVRKLMADKGVRKEPGQSSIEVNQTVHEFVVNDRTHPQTKEIYAKLKSLTKQMKIAGYVPDTKLVLQDVQADDKEYMLGYHSEKLAMAFGIISTPDGAPLCIIKNLRMCSDCHMAAKFVSKIVNREIVVRDTYRFHHFQNGMCTCGDYW
ncbi:hypothetical protein O6H91_04G126900 [Diphasiastrum complanatum]|uniref:Uncharacterized protein n=2 Tax=Diphasiastrum complanatum TaxID=34168 RepID=A0ACC2E197_DIPCM|nr:hypothetical protein O6H91_04G126900 [Diphasiastrum complanatum]KAJ7560385.1 hypothetical protein O6H91_04G126900 [Diphasiastrum complanatum]